VEHKIQSRAGSLQLELQQVPKMLGLLLEDWCPQAFLVSFKLETDPSLLEKKARGALAAYGHHMVVANLLASRHRLVLVFHRDGDAPTEIAAPEEPGLGLEPALVAHMAHAHRLHCRLFPPTAE
jgi:phosphopantothenate-cysteine ligase